jgi:glycosyltransferase 2 family protein
MKRLPLRLALVILALALVFVLARRIDLHQAWLILVDARWGWVCAAALVNLLNTLVEAARWRLILRGLGRPVGIRLTFVALLAGSLGNILLPLKMGEGVRAWLVARRLQVSFLSVVSTTVLDRAIDLVCFVVPLGLAATTFPLRTLLAPRSLAIAVGAAAVLACGLVVLRFVGRAPHAESAPWRHSRLSSAVRNLGAGFTTLRGHRTLSPILAVAVLSWLTRVAVVFAMAKALEIDLSLASAALVLVAINIGIAVISTPGNVGSFEGAAMGVLLLLHTSREAALAYGLGLHVVELVPTVVVAVLLLWFDGAGALLWSERGHLPTADGAEGEPPAEG